MGKTGFGLSDAPIGSMGEREKIEASLSTGSVYSVSVDELAAPGFLIFLMGNQQRGQGKLAPIA